MPSSVYMLQNVICHEYYIYMILYISHLLLYMLYFVCLDDQSQIMNYISFCDDDAWWFNMSAVIYLLYHFCFFSAILLSWGCQQQAYIIDAIFVVFVFSLCDVLSSSDCTTRLELQFIRMSYWYLNISKNLTCNKIKFTISVILLTVYLFSLIMHQIFSMKICTTCKIIYILDLIFSFINPWILQPTKRSEFTKLQKFEALKLSTYTAWTVIL